MVGVLVTAEVLADEVVQTLGTEVEAAVSYRIILLTHRA